MITASQLRSLCPTDRVYVRSTEDADWFRAEVKVIGRAPGRGRPMAAYCRPVDDSSGVKVPAWYRRIDIRLDAPSSGGSSVRFVERLCAECSGKA